MSEGALEPGQRVHEARKERQRELVHREKTRERAREGVMTREERLLGEMRATTVARERRMEVEREREREHVQEIVRMRAREREVGVSCLLTARTLHVNSLARLLTRARAISRSLIVPLSLSRSLSRFLSPRRSTCPFPLHPSRPPPPFLIQVQKEGLLRQGRGSVERARCASAAALGVGVQEGVSFRGGGRRCVASKGSEGERTGLEGWGTSDEVLRGLLERATARERILVVEVARLEADRGRIWAQVCV